MRLIILLALMPSCLYVTSSGQHGETGLKYDCEYRRNGVWHSEEICGPADNDPQYVLDRFDPPSDPAVKVTCTSTPIPCIFYPSPIDDDASEAP